MMRVVVVGAGYAGLSCALRIARKARGRAQVTLINGSAHFVERIRLHEQAAGIAQPVLALDELVRGTGVQLQLGWVHDVDLEQRTLRVDDQAVSWDQLVLATGSEFSKGQVEGAREHAFTLEARSLPWLEGALPAIAQRKGQLAVVGGGLTGIEAAAELAETYPSLRVVLVTRGEVAPECSPAAREHVRNTLHKLGVELRERNQVIAVHADRLHTSQGDLAFAACLWTVGFRASPLAREAGLPVNASGQVMVDAELRARADVHVAGDLAFVPGMPMGCKSAFPTGMLVADNIARLAHGAATRPFRYRHLGYCISLGRRDAVIQLRGSYLRGRLAVRAKELVCKSTVWVMLAESKLARFTNVRFTPALTSGRAHP
ncbi:MAG TPA: FAD-dependent oxidoreductase [Polyangiales bacterium]|nr:FAD-dependent oxidoreductase [Polyangiales bacterium]